MDFTVIISDRKNVKKRVLIVVSRLAKETGYSKSHVSRIFAGKTTPSLKCLVKISIALKISLDELAEVLPKAAPRYKRKTNLRTIYAEPKID